MLDRRPALQEVLSSLLFSLSEKALMLPHILLTELSGPLNPLKDSALVKFMNTTITVMKYLNKTIDILDPGKIYFPLTLISSSIIFCEEELSSSEKKLVIAKIEELDDDLSARLTDEEDHAYSFLCTSTAEMEGDVDAEFEIAEQEGFEFEIAEEFLASAMDTINIRRLGVDIGTADRLYSPCNQA